MWDGLGRPVLKSDLLRLVPLPPTCVARAEVVDRYLMMLVKGGMYTDSDTAPLSDPNLWGTHAHTLTPPSLSALQRAMRHIDPASREYRSQSDIDEDFASNPITDSSRGINNPRISMVISIEYDVNSSPSGSEVWVYEGPADRPVDVHGESCGCAASRSRREEC